MKVEVEIGVSRHYTKIKIIDEHTIIETDWLDIYDSKAIAEEFNNAAQRILNEIS